MQQLQDLKSSTLKNGRTTEGNELQSWQLYNVKVWTLL